MAQEDPAPCFIVIGLVMVVFDIIIIESTYLAVFGGVLLFLGILIAVIENNKKQQAMKRGSIQQQIQPQYQIPPQTPTQIPEIPIQTEIIVQQPPRKHQFCPYCGKDTSLEICPDCGKEID